MTELVIELVMELVTEMATNNSQQMGVEAEKQTITPNEMLILEDPCLNWYCQPYHLVLAWDAANTPVDCKGNSWHGANPKGQWEPRAPGRLV